MIIQPLKMISTTNVQEHNIMIEKINETVDAINGFNPDLQTYDRATIDLKDDTVLAEAKAYADTVIPVHDCYTKEQVDTKDNIVLTNAKSYADSKDATNLNEAKAYADTKQPTLIAGNGIEINGNTISATGGNVDANTIYGYDGSSWDEYINILFTGQLNGKNIVPIKFIAKNSLGLNPRYDISITTTLQPARKILHYGYNYLTGGGITMFAGEKTIASTDTITGSLEIVGNLASIGTGGAVSYQEGSIELLPAGNFTLLYKVV